MRKTLLFILTPLLIPPVFFVIIGIGNALSPMKAVLYMVEQYSTPKYNLGILGVFSMIPYGLLGILLWLHNRAGGGRLPHTYISAGGYTAITLVIIWVQFEFWPNYLPERQFLGFPHGLEFIIGPLFFAPAALALGALSGWIYGRVKTEQQPPDPDS